MNLGDGKSIFDKLSITYGDLRSNKNPIKPIVNYYRSIAKKGEEPWWMDSSNEDVAIFKPTVALWNNMSRDDQNSYRNEAMARFPEIFGKSKTKFQGVASWLAARYGIVSPNLRDQFTASGKVDIVINDRKYERLPRIFSHLMENTRTVINIVRNLPPDDAKYHWGLDMEPATSIKVNLWAQSIMTHAKEILEDSKEFIVHLLGTNFGEDESPTCVREEMERYNLDY